MPGPVAESIAVAPVLLADDERSAGLASGELIATVALPPQVPRAVDADTAGLVLLASEDGVSEAAPGNEHDSVDPSRRLFDVTATGDSWQADVARAYEFGALATAAQLVGAAEALRDAAVDYAKQRTQFGRMIGSYQAIKHKLADVHIAIELARPLVYGAALLAAAARRERGKGGGIGGRPAGGALGIADARGDRVHPGARPVPVAAARASIAIGVGYARGASAPSVGGFVTEERELLRDTVAALVAKHASPAAVRAAMESDKGYDESLWQLLCEQVGAAALVIPEELGGAGGELADAATVLQELGRALVPSPLLGTTLAELALLAAPEPDAETLEGLAEGSSIGALVLDPDYVVNGDIADVVVAGRRRPAEQVDPIQRAARHHDGPHPPAGPACSPKRPSRWVTTPESPTPRPSCWRPSRSAPPNAVWN